jgi:hypothetical protein
MLFPNATNKKLNATENNHRCVTSWTPGISPVWNPAIQTGHHTITRAFKSKTLRYLDHDTWVKKTPNACKKNGGKIRKWAMALGTGG